ncbi:hypothetical protein BDY21DRAFT_338260 [Lineolata rhizophorae]|uniref:Uncharacterized protein n=1 Tax=Lineolata rhizophorae TaxID=578093 RepID=A0A6A6P621_9PEZI|nr:hypothetical protein BDY21DRAFT_338260 [Lineolata rhizophorae]
MATVRGASPELSPQARPPQLLSRSPAEKAANQLAARWLWSAHPREGKGASRPRSGPGGTREERERRRGSCMQELRSVLRRKLAPGATASRAAVGGGLRSRAVTSAPSSFSLLASEHMWRGRASRCCMYLCSYPPHLHQAIYSTRVASRRSEDREDASLVCTRYRAKTAPGLLLNSAALWSQPGKGALRSNDTGHRYIAHPRAEGRRAGK